MKIVILADKKSLTVLPKLERTLLSGCLDLFVDKYDKNDIIIQCPETIREEIKEVAKGASVFTEPMQRGTAPAVGLALMRIVRANPDEMVTIAYSDHPVSYRNNLLKGIEVAENLNNQLNRIVLIGVNPTFPSTEYGYVKIGSVLQEIGSSIAFEKVDFVEKPSKQVAEEILQSWRYLWNTGYLVAKASQILEVYKELLPDIYKGLMTIKEAHDTSLQTQILQTVYENFPSLSIDKGIYEKIDQAKVAVLPVDLQIHDFSDFS